MTDIYWIRHAPILQTGCYVGHTDVEAIIPKGAATISLPDNARWFVSPLQRAIHTAQWLMPSGSAVEYVPALREQHFGTWEGRSYEAVWHEAEHAYDWSRPAYVTPPGGESFADVCARVEVWLKTIMPIHADTPLIVVAHAGSIRAGLCYQLGLTPDEALALVIDYASVTRVNNTHNIVSESICIAPKTSPVMPPSC